MTLVERIQDRTAKVVVVGQGYVGLPVAMRASNVGFPVVGLDASSDRVAGCRRIDLDIHRTRVVEEAKLECHLAPPIWPWSRASNARSSSVTSRIASAYSTSRALRLDARRPGFPWRPRTPCPASF
jgi:hypothetical protein